MVQRVVCELNCQHQQFLPRNGELDSERTPPPHTLTHASAALMAAALVNIERPEPPTATNITYNRFALRVMIAD